MTQVPTIGMALVTVFIILWIGVSVLEAMGPKIDAEIKAMCPNEGGTWNGTNCVFPNGTTLGLTALSGQWCLKTHCTEMMS